MEIDIYVVAAAGHRGDIESVVYAVLCVIIQFYVVNVILVERLDSYIQLDDSLLKAKTWKTKICPNAYTWDIKLTVAIMVFFFLCKTKNKIGNLSRE